MVVIVIYIFIVLVISMFSDINVFDSFIKGSKETYKQLPSLFVNILAIIFSINVFIKSGIVDYIFNLLKINNNYKLIIMQMFLKPISWSSSLLLMNNIFDEFGVDSKLGVLSSLIQSSCDTTFYVVLLYFSYVKISETKHTILASIFAVFLTFLFCIFLINFFVKV